MKITLIFITIAVAILSVTSGVFIYAPILFSGRVAPGLQAGLYTLTGVNKKDVPSIVEAYDKEIKHQTLIFALGEQKVIYSLEELGIALDNEAIINKIQNTKLLDSITRQVSIEPTPVFDDIQLNKQLNKAFVEYIVGPKNATLEFNTAGNLELVPSQPGDAIDTKPLKKAISNAMLNNDRNEPIKLSLTRVKAEVQNNETLSALEYANQILKEGIDLTFAEEVISVKPFTIKRLIRFTEQIDPNNHKNFILGVKFDSNELSNYLETTVAPIINQPTQNARFVLNDDRVEQFSLPEQGQALSIPATASQIAARLIKHERTVQLIANITQPVFSNIKDIERLGLTNKLSTGESDFIGSPKNRAHNISIGASKYHGLLIPPNTEFSFNEFLGPVNAETGYKPELVIKKNVTIPEYGGGLCQVSTTVFRAALNAGLEITQRRNHSYAVSYYGKPGLDATIYPPYTDLRFLNNTPGYILIQARIDGTKLAFDFWGTKDDRQVDITGPVTYDRQANGAVKAYVDQKVMLAGEVIINKTFYSRYKSPKLFPKVLAANDKASLQAKESPPANSGQKTSQQKPINPAKPTNNVSSKLTPKPTKPSPSANNTSP